MTCSVTSVQPKLNPICSLFLSIKTCKRAFCKSVKTIRSLKWSAALKVTGSPGKYHLLLGTIDIITQKSNYLGGILITCRSLVIKGTRHSPKTAHASSPTHSVPNSAAASAYSSSGNKMIQQHKWGLEKFSGSSRGLLVSAFLWSIANCTPCSWFILIKVVHFYRDLRLRDTSSTEFVEKFWREYLPPHHGETIFECKRAYITFSRND